MAIASMKCPECGGDRNARTGTNQYTCQYCGATFVNASEVVPKQPVYAAVQCRFCGGEIAIGAQKCRHCGEWQTPQVQPIMPQPTYQQSATPYQPTSSKSKVVAALLAFFLGGFGAHEFYLGRNGSGLAFLCCFLASSWLVFPMIIIGLICLIQAISYLCMSDQAFAEKYH